MGRRAEGTPISRSPTSPCSTSRGRPATPSPPPTTPASHHRRPRPARARHHRGTVRRVGRVARPVLLQQRPLLPARDRPVRAEPSVPQLHHRRCDGGAGHGGQRLCGLRGRYEYLITLDADDGSGNHVITFYRRADGEGDWTQMGQDTLAGTVSLRARTSPLQVGGAAICPGRARARSSGRRSTAASAGCSSLSSVATSATSTRATSTRPARSGPSIGRPTRGRNADG